MKASDDYDSFTAAVQKNLKEREKTIAQVKREKKEQVREAALDSPPVTEYPVPESCHPQDDELVVSA